MASAPRSWVPAPTQACSLAFIHFNRTLLSGLMKGERCMIQSGPLAQVRRLCAERAQVDYLRVVRNCSPLTSHTS